MGEGAFIINEIMLVFADDEHRATRVANDAFGSAAEEEAVDCGMPMRADDDEICGRVFGQGDYFAVGRPHFENMSCILQPFLGEESA